MTTPPKPPGHGSDEPRTVFRPAPPPGADAPRPPPARTEVKLPSRPPPRDRPPWMDEVLAQPRESPAVGSAPAPATRRSRWPAAALIGIAIAATGLGLAYLGADAPERPPPPAPTARPSPQAAVEVDPVATAQHALAAGLQAVPCAWLDLASLQPGPGGIALAVRGVAGNPGDAQQEINRLLASRGVQAQIIDFEAVKPIEESECGPLDAFAAIRASPPPRLSVPQRQFEMHVLPPDVDDAGKLSAPAIVEFDLKGLAGDATLLGLDDAGAMVQLIPSRDEARALTEKGETQFKELSPDRYRLQLDTSHKGWSGLVLLTGSGPFPRALLDGATGTHDGKWQARFLDHARRQGWKAEMVWYKTVDDVPDATASPGP